MKRLVTILWMFSLLAASTMAETMATMATGDTRGNAIEFDWENGHKQASSATGVSKWYKVDITRLDNAQHPALALYSTNLSTTESVDVKAVVYPPTGNGSLCDWSFSLKPKAFRVESEDFTRAREMGYTHVYILMTIKGANSDVALTVKEYEWERIKEDRDCNRFREVKVDGVARKVDFPDTDPEWMTADISEYLNGKDLWVVIENTNEKEGNSISGCYSYDCPCTGTTPFPDMKLEARTKAANPTTHYRDSFKLTVNELQAIDEPHVYIHVKATKGFGVSIHSVAATATSQNLPPYVDYIWGSQTDFPMGENWMRVAADSLTQMLYVPYVTLSSTVADPKNIKCQLGYVDANGNLVLLPEMDWSFSGTEVTFPLDVNVLMAMPKEYRKNGYIFFHVTCDQDVKIGVGVQEAIHSADCLSATEFDYINGLVVKAHRSEWIHVDLSNKITKYKFLHPHMENLEGVKEKVHVEVVLECPYKDYYSMDFTLDKYEISPKVESQDAWLAHEIYDMADEFWMHITTETDTKLWVEIEDDTFPETEITDMVEFELNKWYTLHETPTWYHYPTALLLDTNMFPADAVPQLVAVNPINEKVTVRTRVAYHNPVDYTPLSLNPEMDPLDSVSHRITRDLMDHYLGRNKNTYVQLSGRYDKLVNQNLGPNDSIRFMVQMIYPTGWVVDTLHLYPCAGDDFYTLEDPIYGGFAPFECYHLDTMFTKIYPFSNDTILRGDSLRTYVVHALRLPVLSDTLRAAEIPALAIEPGETIGLEFQERVMEQYRPYTEQPYMTTPDWATLKWDFLNLPTTTDQLGNKQYVTDACRDTLPMYIAFRYEDDCENLIMHVLEIQFRRRQPIIETADTIRMYACYGTTVSDEKYNGFTPFVLSKDTFFTEHLHYNGLDFCGDSARTYYIYGLRQPAFAQPIAMGTLPALGILPGDALDQTFRDELLSQFLSLVAADSLSQPDLATVAWDYMALPMDYVTDACADTTEMYIALSYADACGNQLADTFVVEYRRRLPVVHVVTETTMAACEGELVQDLVYGGFDPFLMPKNDTTFSVIVRYDSVASCGDSLRNYTVLLRQATYEAVEYATICTGSTYYWRGMALTEKNTYYDTLRYESGCDSLIYTLDLDVRSDYYMANDDYDNMADIHIPAYLKYGNSLLMLDLKEFNTNLHAADRDVLADSSLVAWYLVRGQADIISETGALVPAQGDAEADQLLGHGYYLPVAPASQANYYACITMDNSAQVCGIVYRSQRVSVHQGGSVRLSPNYAPAGAVVRVEGCDGQEGLIRIYTPLGTLVRTAALDAGSDYRFSADGMETGCYFVEIRTKESCSTHRLVIE